jgi:uncharacterized protein
MRGALEDHEATALGPDGKLDLRVSKSGQDVVVRGHLRADLVAPCSRCLEPATIHVDKEISVLAVPAADLPPPPKGSASATHGADASGKGAGGKGKSRGKDDEDDDRTLDPDAPEVLPFSGDVVVLDGVVRDELILETPMTPLCSETCPGMSTGPVEEPADKADGIDPRLLPLLRLRGAAKPSA